MFLNTLLIMVTTYDVQREELVGLERMEEGNQEGQSTPSVADKNQVRYLFLIISFSWVLLQILNGCKYNMVAVSKLMHI